MSSITRYFLTAKRACLLIAYIILLSWFTSGQASAWTNPETITVTAEGVAEILGNDFADARDRAINSALGNAVSRVVKETILPGVGIPDTDFVDETLAEPSRNYISEYRIMDEKIDGASYLVNLSATVRAERIAKLIEDDGAGIHLRDYNHTDYGTSESAFILLRIRGIVNYSQYGAFKTFFMNNINGVDAVLERLVQYGILEFEVHTANGADWLAAELTSATVPGVELILRSRKGNRVEVDVVQ
ncbi:MAG: hypothetical protein PHU03_04605 [Syntrophales bacterium]|nr:hypothetical protein [Syntrophales bacterium]